MKKKFISAALAAAMVLSSSVVFGALPASAENVDYGLPANSEDGAILHCFDWSFNAIKENLPGIAAAGYTTIQTSPVQQPKDYGDWLNNNGQWWKLYQPLSFKIAESDSWLGTKDELAALCEEAEKYGIKVIVDIVSNHMANQSATTHLTVSKTVQKYEPEIYKNKSETFHQLAKSISDDRPEWLLQGEMNFLPDLNTSNELVQSRVKSLLRECIDCGVDGFRFDAAKHIETPSDGDYASDFWPNVTGDAKAYAAEKGVELYMYGEILNSPGKGRSMSYYTPYINVLDNKMGNNVLSYVRKDKAKLAGDSLNYSYDVDPAQLVVWAESHDTYMETGSNSTSSVDNDDIVKTWALVSSRAKSRALYFARPNDLMGLAGDTTWKSNVVTEINRFRNTFAGVDDAIVVDGDAVGVQRGDSGIVVVNLGSGSDISFKTSGMKDGSYIDTITGKTFTVEKGVLKGTIDTSGVAVVYGNAAVTPHITVDCAGRHFRGDTLTINATAENAENAYYSINGGNEAAFNGTAAITIGEGVAPGTEIKVEFKAVNGSKTITTTETYYKDVVEHTGVFIYYDNSKTNYKNVYCHAFYDDVDANGRKYNVATVAKWPGVLMEYNSEKGLYEFEVPSNIPVNKGEVIINNGIGWETAQLKIEHQENLYSEKTKKLVDANNPDPEPEPQPPVPVTKTYTYGDVDKDGYITASDALIILRISVGLEKDDSELTKKIVDIDSDNSITSADALAVLRESVGMTRTGNVGQTFEYAEAGSTPATGESLVYVVNSAGWLFNDGGKMWIMNADTKEAVETEKADPSDDKSAYSSAKIPNSWKNLSLVRTSWNLTPDDAGTDPAHAVWNCGEIPEGKNAIVVRGNGDSNIRFKAYTPS
ncbi:MAG: starch-binding protein [Clostridia bacterium]|nr:starch-binding protein [Clostridia bacterium]